MKLSDEEKARRLEFIDKYGKLCEEYHLTVNSCGCCNGPWVIAEKQHGPNDTVADHIQHLKREVE